MIVYAYIAHHILCVYYIGISFMKININDLVGQKINKLEVLSIANKTNKWRHTFYNCRCECGKETIVRRNSLKQQTTKSCGKCWPKHLDISGQKFGLFTVINLSHQRNGKMYWNCLCECGKEKIICSGSLVSGNTSTCGNRHIIGSKHKNWKGCGQISRQYWNCLIRGAKQRNIIFNITIEDGWNLFLSQNKQCALSGVDLCFAESYTTQRIHQTASLDRIDSSKGYTLDNIQWVHKEINMLKMNCDNQKFIEICRQVAKHNIKDDNEALIRN
jgi:hypothetical protein